MTQKQQEAFAKCVESAHCWIQAVHERLRANDNTAGPRAALETRLRETEAIRESEPEGWVKVDMALGAAETLLRSGDEKIRGQTLAKLKELKALWEETSTYIMHCHSRIEWVWLHWEEYLKALEEFYAWLRRMQQALGPQLELQLGAREKAWHLEHHRVLLGDIQAQGPPLDRLLEEAADLQERIQDPSLGSGAHKSLKEAYNEIKDRAEERVSLLQKMAEDHRVFDASMQQFWAWLGSMSEELTRYSGTEDTPQNMPRPLQVGGMPKRMPRPLKTKDMPRNTIHALEKLRETVDREEGTLRHLEGTSESIKANTSPLGAEQITVEIERLRQNWEELRQRVRLAEETRRVALNTQKEYTSLCEKVQAEASRLHLRLQELEQELEPADGEEKMEDDEVLWRKYMHVLRSVAAEEAHVEHLKARLTELFHVSQDPTLVSDQVLNVLKAYQGVKGHAFRLWTEKEAALRRAWLDSLQSFSKWGQLVNQILEGSEEVNDLAHIDLMVQKTESLLKDSQQLQERLEQLQAKRDLLVDIFVPEKAEDLGAELSAAVREREKQHTLLLQRKSHLQHLLSRTEEFEDAYKRVQKELSILREKCITTDKLQPDILAKKTLCDQLTVILGELEDCEAQLTAMKALPPQSPADQLKVKHLCTQWKELHKDMKDRVLESERSSQDHQDFQEKLLGLEKRLLEARPTLESLVSMSAERGMDRRQAEVERALKELPELELELRRIEAWGQKVLAKTSEDGKEPITHDIQRLQESWANLGMLSQALHRFPIGDGVVGGDFHMTEGEGEGKMEGQVIADMDVPQEGGEEKRPKTGDEGDCMGQSPSVGWRVGTGDEEAGNEQMDVGQDLRTERGLGAVDDDTALGQGARTLGGSVPEDKGRIVAEIVGMDVGRDDRTEKGLDFGGKGTDFGQSVKIKRGLGAINERVDSGNGIKGEGTVGDKAVDFGQVSQTGELLKTEVQGGVGAGGQSGGLGSIVSGERGMGVEDEGEFGAEDVGTHLGQSVRDESGLKTGDDSQGLGQHGRSEGVLGAGDEEALHVPGEQAHFEQGVNAKGVSGVEHEDEGLGQALRDKGRLIVRGEAGSGAGHRRVRSAKGVGTATLLSAVNEGKGLGRGVRAEEALVPGDESRLGARGEGMDLGFDLATEDEGLELEWDFKVEEGDYAGVVTACDELDFIRDSILGPGEQGAQPEQDSVTHLRVGNEGEGMDLGKGITAEEGLHLTGGGLSPERDIRAEAKVSAGTESTPAEHGIRADEELSPGIEGTGLGRDVVMSGPGDEDLSVGAGNSTEGAVSAGERSGAGGEGMVFQQGVRADGVTDIDDSGRVGPGPVKAFTGECVKADRVLVAGDDAGLGAGVEGTSLGWGMSTEEGLYSKQNSQLFQGSGQNQTQGQNSSAKGIRAEREFGTGDEGVSLRNDRIDGEGVYVRGESMNSALGTELLEAEDNGSGDDRMGSTTAVCVSETAEKGRSDTETTGEFVGQGVRAERVLVARNKGGFDSEHENSALRMGFGAEAEFCVKGEGLSLGQNFRDKARVEDGVEGTYVERGIEAEDDLRAIALGQNPTDVLINQSLIEQEPSAHQLKFGFDEVDKEGGYRQRASKNDMEGGSVGGSQTIHRGLSGRKQGKVTEKESLPQETSGTSVDQSGQHTQVGLGLADGANLQGEFEAWLEAENTKLSAILSQKEALTAKELKLRQKELKELRARIGWGQTRLQEVLMFRGEAGAEDPGLEELRYRWVLYKSKLQDVEDLKDLLEHQDTTVVQEEPLKNGKKRSGLLQRACCFALPFQLLLLSLLLLAFFLPLTEEGASCSLANNFARSFRLMLRYEAPPPT